MCLSSRKDGKERSAGIYNCPGTWLLFDSACNCSIYIYKYTPHEYGLGLDCGLVVPDLGAT